MVPPRGTLKGEVAHLADQTAGADVKLDTPTRLAFERTRLAHDRTMLGWIRTATSLILFGFTLYKFFQIEMAGHLRVEPLVGPRGLGLFMISTGLISLLLATVQHVQGMRALRAHWPEAPRSLAAILAALIAVLGILALVATLFQR